MFSILAGVVWRPSAKGFEVISVVDMYLGILAALEKWSDANESNIIIPHNSVILVISRNFEYVLEDCKSESARIVIRSTCMHFCTFKTFTTGLL